MATTLSIEHKLKVSLEPWLATVLPTREDLDWVTLGSQLRSVCDAHGLSTEEGIAVFGGLVFKHLQEKFGS